MSITGKLQYNSQKNTMKRTTTSVSTTMLGPITSRFSGSFYTNDLQIPHGLNVGKTTRKVPMFRAFYEPFRDGKVFECFQDTQYYYSNPINTYGGTEDAPTMLAFADDINITLRLFFTQNIYSATPFNVHVIIYQDYGAAA
jgi:hypothetical protein